MSNKPKPKTTGVKINFGRTTPTPSNTLKPTTKPKK